MTTKIFVLFIIYLILVVSIDCSTICSGKYRFLMRQFHDVFHGDLDDGLRFQQKFRFQMEKTYREHVRIVKDMIKERNVWIIAVPLGRGDDGGWDGGAEWRKISSFFCH